MKNNKIRVLIWIVLLVITLGIGTTGLILSGDLKNIGFLKHFYKVENKINLNFVAQELNNYLDEYFINTDTVAAASALDNILSVTINNDENINFEFILNDDILSGEFGTEDSTIGTDLFNRITAIVQNKYFDVEIENTLTTLSSANSESFTIKNDGYEKREENNNVLCKLNVSKKITIINLSDSYIKTSDLVNETEFIKENDTYQKSLNNIIIEKTVLNNKIIISVYEKDNLTENTYKSLISFLTILFDENEATSFTNQYPVISTDTNFDKYTVEINPEPSEKESLITANGYQFIRVTINNE